MSTPINTILSWFETGDFPTQEQFAASWTSFRHKDESIPMDQVENLNSKLQEKVDKTVYNTHLINEDAHITTLAKLNASNLNDANVQAWKTILGVGDLPANIATVDDGVNSGNVYTKDQSDENYMQNADFVGADGKILASMIEALGLTELISVTETSLSAFMANNVAYQYEKNDFIAIPNGSGNYALYIYNGGSKTVVSSYLPTGLTNITIAMVEGLQAALNAKMDKPSTLGNFFIRSLGPGPIYASINPAANYLIFWDGQNFKESNMYHNAGKTGIGITDPTELLHLDGRVRSKAVVFDENTELLPNQITLWNRRFHGTDLTGNRRMLMYRDYEDYLALIQSLSPIQKENIATVWNGQYSNGSLNVYSITPTVIKNDHVVRYLVLQGLNLNVNPATTSVKFIPVGSAIGTTEVDCLGFQPSADGKSMIVSVYGDTLTANTQYNVIIRTTSPVVQTHRTTSNINVVTNIDSIDVSAINWQRIAYTSGQENTIFTTNGGLFSYSSNPANKAYAYEPNIFVAAIKSDTIFPANSNFYIEFNVGLSISGNQAISDVFDFYAYLGLVQSNIPLALSDNSFIRIINSCFRSGAYISTAMWNNIISNSTKIEPGSTPVMNANIVIMRQGNVYTQFLTVGGATIVQTVTSNTDAVSISLAVTNGTTPKSINASIVQAFKF
ncbi:hypothetical protein OK18_19040 [Chryseobacterium gallinarum]|uniref:Uncharacterized protein n=1 Tax=Chryseobacterium gallinarum TaxID=1324352 RepID=A0A0G3M8W8_CHRGL|nr:hypothetical protein [Chryseobacterium gallinarum]AKK74428.1 hypothetical protein OK18_19040 [Chryseobacterium gallinarum]